MAEQTVVNAAAGSPTWWSRAILIGAVVGSALLPIGALGTRIGVWHFQIGLLLVAAGAVLAAIGLVVGIAGIIAASRRRLASDKPAVYVGTAISLLVLALMGTQFLTGLSVPPIHNISTDVVDPPAFDKIVTLRGEGTNPLEYDADSLAAVQREAYPGIKTLETSLAPAESLQRASAVLKDMGLEIVHVDEQAGIIEATATTAETAMMMPSVVSALRNGFALSSAPAIRTFSTRSWFTSRSSPRRPRARGPSACSAPCRPS